MRQIINILSLTCLLLLLCSSKAKKNNSRYTLAFVKDIYVDEGNYTYNDRGDSTYTKGDGERTENFIGIFSKKYDTVTIYKLNKDLNEKPEKFSFWSKKKNNQSITFYCSMGDDIKVTFNNQNIIIVNNDTYQVNKAYYSFLKQKILTEKSVLDLTFFLKDGYGDYEQSLRPLNKNWRNQKEDNRFKIIKAKIKNKNHQTDGLFFNYNFTYKYGKNGMVENILGENSFNKIFVKENNKYIVYTIDRSINERASDNEYLYKNKKTFFDSIVGNRVRYSNATAYYYREYQSKLKLLDVAKKPKNIEEAIKSLKINNKEFD
ncbi:hypothetical protein [uncultured Flavobacterium sp.]|uniref:hypothetical protein n=1 Tax=uncultured Flavobacterium sp. TaxID=165435 RepID=UPI00292F929E|nr:hypothetical protein [uncultured Flavobacterium sp.]